MTNRHGRLRLRVAVFVCVAAVLLLVDQLTKAWAMAALGDGKRITVIPKLLSLQLVRNPGASLGFGSNSTWVFGILAIVACIVLAVLALRSIAAAWLVTFSLAFAGAAGNLIDRVMYADGFLNGKVVDFLDYGWSIGNVADVYLVIAAVLCVVLIAMNVPLLHSEPRGDE